MLWIRQGYKPTCYESAAEQSRTTTGCCSPQEGRRVEAGPKIDVRNFGEPEEYSGDKRHSLHFEIVFVISFSVLYYGAEEWFSEAAASPTRLQLFATGLLQTLPLTDHGAWLSFVFGAKGTCIANLF